MQDSINKNPMISFNPDSEESLGLKKSRFTERLLEENALGKEGFECWIFCQGMLFCSLDKWWGDQGRRDHPHEGIDLCLYGNRSRNTRRLDKGTRIPVMHDGVVRVVSKDFLGETIVIEHEMNGIGRFVSMYAHTEPRPHMKAGVRVKEGDIIGTLGDTGRAKSGILPHLHVSVGIPSHAFSYDRFDWNTMTNPGKIVLLDPLPLMDRPHQILAADRPLFPEF